MLRGMRRKPASGSPCSFSFSSSLSSLPLALSAWIALGLVGCASAPPVPVAPGPFEPLAEGEGYLIVQVDTRVGIERLEASDRVLAQDLPPGEHLWLVRMKAGRYRWSKVRFLPQSAATRTVQTRDLEVFDQREFEFDVEAGQVNYPGEILVRVGDEDEGLDSGFSLRSRNRAAMAIRGLRKTHPELIDALPLRYAGTRDDEFLKAYTAARRAVAEKRAAPRVGGPKPDEEAR